MNPKNTPSEWSFLNETENKKVPEVREFLNSRIGKLPIPFKPNKEAEFLHLASKLLVRGLTVAQLDNLNASNIADKTIFYVPQTNRIIDSGININNRFGPLDTTIIGPDLLLSFFEIRYSKGNHISDADEDYIQKRVASFLNRTLIEYIQKNVKN